MNGDKKEKVRGNGGEVIPGVYVILGRQLNGEEMAELQRKLDELQKDLSWAIHPHQGDPHQEDRSD